MPSEENIKDLVQNFNEHHRGKTFAEFIATLFEGKYIEVYLGDAYEEISTEQISMSYPAVFCGKVVAAFKECLILNSVYVDRVAKKVRDGNIVFVNERAIRGLTEIDGEGIMEDMFLRSKESLIVKDFFIDKAKK
jgi:hypothetical protein